MARVLVQDTSTGEFFLGGGKWGKEMFKGFDFEEKIWADHFIALQQQGKRRCLATIQLSSVHDEPAAGNTARP